MSKLLENGNELVLDDMTLGKLKSIFNGMPGGFFIYKDNEEEELVYFNQAMLNIFGCKTEEQFIEHTHNSFKGIVHPDDYQRVSQSIREQITDSPYKLDYVEYRITRRDGSTRWIEDYGRHTSTGAYGDIFYVFIDDATERRDRRTEELERVNEQLKNAHTLETQYKKALTHDAAAVFELNLTKNEFIHEQTNLKETENQNLFDFITKDKKLHFSELTELMSKYVDGKDMLIYREFFNVERLIKCYENDDPLQFLEATFTDVTGKVRILHFTVLIGKNEVTGDIIALSMVKDITQSSMQNKLYIKALSQANAENIASNAALREAYRQISVPLNNISCFIEVSENNSSDPKLLKYCLDKIDEASRKLIEIANNTLKEKGINARINSSDHTECDLSDLINEIKKKISLDAAEKHISVSADISSVKNFKVYADTISLEEGLWYMLDNAVKYTDESGHIEIKLTELDSSSAESRRYLFEIADNGIGISEDYTEHIFEPFIREDNETVKSTAGSGMGLAVVKNIFDKMNGTVSVKSEKGKGSCFAVDIEFPTVK